MIDVASLMCCGVDEISGISRYRDPDKVMFDYCKSIDIDTDRPHCAFVIFTQAGGSSKYGERLFEFIKANRFGKIRKSSRLPNPNTRRIVVVYTWEADFKKIKKWYTSHEKYAKSRR
jgi:hypothetical protein